MGARSCALRDRVQDAAETAALQIKRAPKRRPLRCARRRDAALQNQGARLNRRLSLHKQNLRQTHALTPRGMVAFKTHSDDSMRLSDNLRRVT